MQLFLNRSFALVTSRSFRLQAYNPYMHYSNLVVVQAFGSQGEADLAKSVLESAGVDAMIQSDRAGGMRDHLAWSGFGFKVLVREEDAAAARDLLTPPPESELVLLQTFTTEDQADSALGALLSSGILAELQTDGPTGGPPDLRLLAHGFRVLVRKDDLAAAREILNSLSKPQP